MTHVCACMCIYKCRNIFIGYVICSDRNLAKLRTKPMSLKLSPRDTCFHHLHAKQFRFPTASTFPH